MASTTMAFIEKVRNAPNEKRNATIAKTTAFYAKKVVEDVEKTITEKGMLPTKCTFTSSIITTIFDTNQEAIAEGVVSAMPAVLKETFSDAEFAVTYEVETVYACYRITFTITPTWPPM